jgi:DNA-binding PadR family transcriptional regulator
MNNQDFSDLHLKVTQELRRGVLILATLSQLKEAKYGYALISSLAERGLEIEQGTLYPLLRRLEAQGLLKSEWNVEGSRPRRYYIISPAGSRMLEKLTSDWSSLVGVMQKLLDEPSNGGDHDESD